MVFDAVHQLISLKISAVIFILAMVTVIGCSNAYVQKKKAGTFIIHTDINGPCHACHQGSGAISGSESLLAPGKELCFRCHVFKSQKKVVHKAVEIWGCVICHNPHGSRYPYLLREPLPKLCFICHDEKVVLPMAAHKSSTKICTDCHNPHMSDNKFLLSGS
jgi:predicted CXXCH cytochrome family protein